VDQTSTCWPQKIWRALLDLWVEFAEFICTFTWISLAVLNREMTCHAMTCLACPGDDALNEQVWKTSEPQRSIGLL
jgi:hypothetical protein